MTKGKLQLQPTDSIKAIQCQLNNLDEIMGRLLEIAKSIPAGDLKERLFYEVSCLDSIADVIRQELNSCVRAEVISGIPRLLNPNSLNSKTLGMARNGEALHMDSRQLLKSIDSLIACNPSSTVRSLAKELNVTVWKIEKAVREIDGVCFNEYMENRHLAHVPDMLEHKREAENRKDTRAEPRRIIPGATVSYLLQSNGIQESASPTYYPISDLSKGGLAFLSDLPLQPGERVSLSLNCIQRKDELCLEGYIVYTLAVEIAGYQYRVGVRFVPFDEREGFNPPETLDALTELIKRAVSQIVEPQTL